MEKENVLFISDIDRTLIFPKRFARDRDVCIEWAKDGVTVCVYDGEKYLFDESVKELTPKEEIEKVCKEFSLPSDKYCKPSIGETTRVLLRRTPWKILVNEKAGEESEELRLLLELAKEKEIPVEQYPLQNYKAIGLIKVLH